MVDFYKFSKLLEEAYDSQTQQLYKSFSEALEKWYSGKIIGKPPINVSFDSEVVKNLGFDFSQLRRSGIVVQSSAGNWELNKDLVSVSGNLGSRPPVPALPQNREQGIKPLSQMPSWLRQAANRQ